MKLNNVYGSVKGVAIPLVSALMLLVLVGIAIFSVKSGAKQFSGEAMANDIIVLAGIFDQIQKNCTILSFDVQKNPINFLTVGSFAGSEIGSMNIAHPDRWGGPYLKDNLAMQGIEYQVVRTDAGFFIVPGEGVELPNGQIIGKDLVLDTKADIATLMQANNALNFKGKPLARQISVGKNAQAMQDISLTEIPSIDDF